MWIRNTALGTAVVTAFMLATGCKPSAPNQGKAAISNEPAAMVHWLGIKRVAADPNAAGFLKIWKLRETQAVLAQTLDKLALAPWRLSGPNPPPAVTNYAPLMREYPTAALLRPLLDDLVQDEWHLQVRQNPDQTAQVALAIRLNPQHMGIWETNLHAALGSSKTQHWIVQPNQANRGWDYHLTNSPPASPLLGHIELAHAGEWTLLGFAPGQNAAFTALLAQSQKMSAASTNKSSWLETTLDLPRLSAALGWHWDLPKDWPTISLTLNGDGQHVITGGQFTFPKPLPNIEPWNIPTNLIHEPVQSFTAMQGIEPWLSSFPAWQELRAGRAPNQLFCWAQSGSPFLDYAAAPAPDAHEVAVKIAAALMEKMNPTLATNRMGKWERAPDSDGVVWKAPAITAFVRSSKQPQGNYVLAGLAPFALTNGAPPVGTLKDLLSHKNIMYFDSEITGPRVEAWLYIGQLFRIIFRREQLPPRAWSLAWLRTLTPMLGNSYTLATRTGPNQLALFRRSTIGLTGDELHLLVDWLESSEFPGRPHSLVAKLRPPPAPHFEKQGSGDRKR